MSYTGGYSVYYGVAIAVVVVLLIVGAGLYKSIKEQPNISKSEKKRKKRNRR